MTYPREFKNSESMRTSHMTSHMPTPHKKIVNMTGILPQPNE